MRTNDINVITRILREIVGKKIEESDSIKILDEIKKEHYLPLDFEFWAPSGRWEVVCNTCSTSESRKCKRKGAKSGYLNRRIKEIAEQLGII